MPNSVQPLLPDPNDRPLLRAGDVAPVLGVALHSVYEMVRSDELPHRRIGKRVYFSNLAFRRHMGLPEQGPIGASVTPPARGEPGARSVPSRTDRDS